MIRTLVLFLGTLTLAPLVVHAAEAAQTGGAGSLNLAPITNLSNSIIGLINNVVVPFIFAVAFLVFIWGVYTYFIAGGANEEKRSEGAKFVLSAVIGFAVMLSIWGLVRIVIGTFPGLAGQDRPNLPCFTSGCTPSQ